MAVIAVDFDHTLVEGDKAIEGSKDAINLLREKGHKIVIWSANEPRWIEKTLNNHDIRFDHIWVGKGKPLADMYIDDKAYRFLDWSKGTLSDINLMLQDLDNRKWEAFK